MFSKIIIILFLTCSFVIYFYIYSKINSRNYSNGRLRGNSFGNSFRGVFKFILFFSYFIGLLSIFFREQFFCLYSLNYISFLGVLVFILGFLEFLIAIRTLGNHYSPCYESYLPNKFIQKGVYSFVRHPIYSGNLISLLGLLLISGSPLLLIPLILLFVYYYQAAKREEKDLASMFPDYLEYKKQTKMFLPFIF